MEKKSTKKTEKPRRILEILWKQNSFFGSVFTEKTVNTPRYIFPEFLSSLSVLNKFVFIWNLADYSKQNALLRG